MAGKYRPRAETLLRRSSDPGYRVAWKLKYGFQKGYLEGEMTYGEAKRKAEEMMAKDPEKVYWPELIMDPAFEEAS